MKKPFFSTYFGDAPFWRRLLALALPVALQNLLTSSFSMIDTVMVSQLGGDELSAIGMVGQWSWLFVTLLFGFSSGSAALQSQYWGLKDKARVQTVFTVGLSGALFALLPFFVLPLINAPLVMSFFNEDAAIIDIGSRYLRIVLWSYPGVALGGMLSATLRATEHVRLPMVTSVLSALLNVAGNYALIFGLGPLPAMGVEGAALATVISSWFSPILLLIVSLCKRNVLYGSPRAYFGLDRKRLKDILARLLPVVGNELIYGLATLVLALIFSNLGKEEYGGVTIFNSVSNLMLSFYQGVCSACCIMVGKAVGAGRIREAVRDAKRFSLLGPAISLLIGLLLILLRTPIIALFNLSGGLSAVTVRSTYAILLFYGLEIALRNIPNLQVIGVLRAGGNVMAATVFDLTCLWLLVIPTALLTSYLGLPFLAVFIITYLCEDVSKTVLCLIFFFKEKWLKPVTEEGRAALLEYQAEKGGTRSKQIDADTCDACSQNLR